MTLSVAIAEIQDIAREIHNIKDAPVLIPEGEPSFPFAISYPRTGTLDLEAGQKKGLHTIFTEIHMSRGLLGTAVEQVLNIMVNFESALLGNVTLSGAVDTIVFPIKYTFGRLEWGNTATVGIRYEITVKIHESIGA